MKNNNSKIKVMEPHLSRLEKKYLMQTFEQNEVSVFGDMVNKVKKKIIKSTNCQNLTLTNSGSSALILGLNSLDLKNNDIIITSNYTFIATLNSIIHSRLKPWIFDIEKESFSIDLINLEQILNKNTYKKKGFTYHKKTNQRVSAIMPVIFCGIVPNLKKIKSISKKFNLKIIIDCAGGFIQLIKNKDIIRLSDIVITSFNGNKSITSGGGGAIFSKNKRYFYKFDNLSDNSKIGKYIHNDFGFNYKMTNLHASILLGQIERIEYIVNKKKFIHNFYKQNLKSTKFELVSSNEVMWLNLIKIKNLNDKKKIINKLRKNNIFLERFWVTMNNQKKIKNNFLLTPCPLSDSFSERILVIPSSTFLSSKELKKIVNLLNTFN